MPSTVIVGAGRVGKIRAEVIRRNGSKVVAVADVDSARAKDLARGIGAEATTDWLAAVHLAPVEAVVVCTPTKFHAEATIAALRAGKHVLCEKPLGRNVEEAQKAASVARGVKRILKTGFNYRHMNHVLKAKELLDANAIGPVYFFRSRYGHGGRPNYEKEWCTDADLSGGGVLLEQGIHLFDLLRFLLDEPVSVCAQMRRFFWNFPVVEDNAFCMLKLAHGQTAQIHVSWTQWLNIFELEIFGRDGFLCLEGRDGHYGSQRLTWAMRKPDHSRPQLQVFDFPSLDDSWDVEWREFVAAIEAGREPSGSGEDGVRTQQLIECAYRSAAEDCWITIPDRLEIQKGAFG